METNLIRVEQRERLVSGHQWLDDANLSPRERATLGVTSAKSTFASSPQSQPVPHHGELEGVGFPGASACFAEVVDDTYTLPEAERAKIFEAESCNCIMFCLFMQLVTEVPYNPPSIVESAPFHEV
jgi:hypothetical protein